MAVSSESARGRLADCSGFGNICLYRHHTETGLTMQTSLKHVCETGPWSDSGPGSVLGSEGPEDLVLDNQPENLKHESVHRQISAAGVLLVLPLNQHIRLLLLFTAFLLRSE